MGSRLAGALPLPRYPFFESRVVKTMQLCFARVPYARYAPVRRQLLNVLRAVNKARSKQRFDELPHSAVKLRRVIVKPFGEESA